MKRSVKRTIGLAFLNLFFISICLAGLIPILYAFLLSVSSGSGALTTGLSLLPEKFTLDNYRSILVEKPFLKWLFNSVLLSTGTMVLAMGTSVTASYAFSRFRFPGRTAIMQLLLLLNAFPQILSMFAIFRLFKLLNLLNSHAGLIFIYSGSMCIFSIWNMKGYFDSIPVEIEEASKIDGAGNLTLIAKIILPLARPAIIVTAVMVLIFVWNEYLFATTFMNSNDMQLVTAVIASAVTQFGVDYGCLMTTAMLASIPAIIMFIAIQRFIVGGLTAGGIKG